MVFPLMVIALISRRLLIRYPQISVKNCKKTFLSSQLWPVMTSNGHHRVFSVLTWRRIWLAPTFLTKDVVTRPSQNQTTGHPLSTKHSNCKCLLVNLFFHIINIVLVLGTMSKSNNCVHVLAFFEDRSHRKVLRLGFRVSVIGGLRVRVIVILTWKITFCWETLPEFVPNICWHSCCR